MVSFKAGCKLGIVQYFIYIVIHLYILVCVCVYLYVHVYMYAFGIVFLGKIFVLAVL